MKTYLDCIPCFLDQALRAARAATGDENIQRQVLDSVAGMLPGLPLDVTPPEIARRVYGIVADLTGNEDPYYEAKQQANRLALSLYPELKEVIAASSDPLFTACRLAIAGNSIDMGPRTAYGDLESIVQKALTSPLVVNDYEILQENLARAARILYLGDNAGEIVFDKMLIEELRQYKEGLEITFVVRERPIINDVTMKDAVDTGMDRVATCISNGSDTPSTHLSRCPAHLESLFRTADVIVSKGQGNFEALSGEQGNIFFMLKAKCSLVAKLLGVHTGDAVLKHQKI